MSEIYSGREPEEWGFDEDPESTKPLADDPSAEIDVDLDIEPIDLHFEAITLSTENSEGILGIDVLDDSEESVDRYLRDEFSSAVETEEKEEAIKQIIDKAPEMLRKFGLENSASINEEMIDELMGYGYEDEDDIENLYFYVWDKFKQEFGPFSRIRPEYMMDFADRKDSDSLEKEQNDHAIFTLIEIGVDADAALDVKGNTVQRRNMRRLCWIMENEPSLTQPIQVLQETKPQGVSIDVKNLAQYVHNYLANLKETMDSMDLSKMDNLDKNKHRGQVGLLRCSIAVAESIIESSKNT